MRRRTLHCEATSDDLHSQLFLKNAEDTLSVKQQNKNRLAVPGHFPKHDSSVAGNPPDGFHQNTSAALSCDSGPLEVVRCGGHRVQVADVSFLGQLSGLG